MTGNDKENILGIEEPFNLSMFSLKISECSHPKLSIEYILLSYYSKFSLIHSFFSVLVSITNSHFVPLPLWPHNVPFSLFFFLAYTFPNLGFLLEMIGLLLISSLIEPLESDAR